MARSVSVAVVAPLLLLSVLVSTAAAARAVGDTVQETCSKTQFPKICADSLAAKPESAKATPRKLAELFVNVAAEKGAAMATFVHGKNNAAGKKDDKLFVCYDSCSDDVEEAVAHLNGLVREPTDAKFLELKSWLSSTLGGTSTCEDACKDAPKSGDKDAVVSYSVDFEKLQRITLDLITEASGSMSSAGIALPPSDAGAPSYGAAAAPYGGSADASTGAGGDGGSEGPAASGPSADANAPSYGGSAASGPAAADADADAPAAASGPSGASAPSSSESSGAPGPSSDGSSSAGAPDSGDDDDDDDSNDSSA